MVLDIYLSKQKVCDAIQGTNQSKSVNQEERFGDIYISSLKPTKTCSTRTLWLKRPNEHDFKHQLFRRPILLK